MPTFSVCPKSKIVMNCIVSLIDDLLSYMWGKIDRKTRWQLGLRCRASVWEWLCLGEESPRRTKED